MKFCKNCGNQLEDGATFCGACGTAQDPIPSAPNPTPVAPQPGQFSNPIPPQNPVYGAAGGAMPMAAPKKKTKAPLIIGIVAAIFLVIVLVIVLVSCSGSKLSVEDVKTGELNGYNSETIGNAFEDYFSNCSWDEYEVDSYSVVEFKGHISSAETGNDIVVIVQFAHDADEDEKGEFYIYSTKIRDNDEGDYTYLTDSELEGMLDAIYYDGVFSWSWY